MDINNFQQKLSHQPVILFGAKAIGVVTKKMLERIGIKVRGFADNDEKMQGKYVDDIFVHTPEQMVEQFPDGIVIICRLFAATQQEIEAQLIRLGCQQIVPCLLIWHRVKMGGISQQQWEESFATIYNRKPPLFLPSVECDITEYCSLSCQECANLMPYFSKPKHFDMEIVIQGMKSLAQSTCGIGRVVIVGGEPFLYPDLGRICEELSAIEHVLSVQITTNGTIVPDEHLLEQLKNSVAYIVISDYGVYSRHKEALITILEKHQIPYEIRGQGKWWRTFGKPTKYARTEEENQQIFQSCPYKGCLSVLNGVFRLCPRSNYAVQLGEVPEHPLDHVSLLDETVSFWEKAKQLDNFINKTTTYFPCSYCMGATGELILPAIQSENTKMV